MKANDGWLRVLHVIKRPLLFAEFAHCLDEPTYLPDISVWLPDVRWGLEAMPACPNCATNSCVTPHAFRSDHSARKICGLNTNYFMISRRYICSTCKEEAATAKRVAFRLAREVGLNVTMTDSDEEEEANVGDTASPAASKPPPEYTFMGWDKSSVPHLPWGYSMEFPAFLTRRNGLDMEVVDLMRQAFEKGVRPEALSKIMLELHTKRYTKAYIKREYNLSHHRLLQPDYDPGMYSTFGDKKRYGGLVPTGIMN
jgi:hypothetical protein